MKKYLMLPLVSVFFFISIPSASAADFCNVKQVVGNTYENSLCSIFSDREVCDYSLEQGDRYWKDSSKRHAELILSIENEEKTWSSLLIELEDN